MNGTSSELYIWNKLIYNNVTNLFIQRVTNVIQNKSQQKRRIILYSIIVLSGSYFRGFPFNEVFALENIDIRIEIEKNMICK